MEVNRIDGGQADGPFEGVPTHLRKALLDWWRGVYDPEFVSWWRRAREVNLLVALMRFDVAPHWETRDIVEVLLQEARHDAQFLLDLVDGTLQVFDLAPAHVDALSRLLRIAGSVWTWRLIDAR
jgi:hypothetical protein